MRERRKQERKSLVAYTQVYDIYGGFLIGYLGDLSAQGAMVITEKSMESGQEITLGIEVPELPNIKATRMSLAARVAWCEPDISPQFFNVGFEFKQVTSQQMSLIQTIIANYEFRRDAPNYPPRPDGQRP